MNKKLFYLYLNYKLFLKSCFTPKCSQIIVKKSSRQLLFSALFNQKNYNTDFVSVAINGG